MKIIKEGKLPKKVHPVLKGTCGNCGCVIECDPSEVSGVRGGIAYAKCPTDGCDKHITVIPKMEDEYYRYGE